MKKEMRTVLIVDDSTPIMEKIIPVLGELERKMEIAVLMISRHTNRFCSDLCKKLGTPQLLDISSTVNTIPIPLSAAC
jgi:hypothetical protein